jgi:hypothetical protein
MTRIEIKVAMPNKQGHGPAAELSDSAKLFIASREIDRSMGKKVSSRELIFCKTKCSWAVSKSGFCQTNVS